MRALVRAEATASRNPLLVLVVALVLEKRGFIEDEDDDEDEDEREMNRAPRASQTSTPNSPQGD